MITEAIKILAIPFIGTALGAATVFFIRKNISEGFNRKMNAFAAGIMIAASVWSLILPALELAAWQKYPFISAAVGLWAGVLLFYALDKWTSRSAYKLGKGRRSILGELLPMLAVAIHNFPEGMALGVVFAAWAEGGQGIPYSAVAALAIGIGVQNFPEGSIISLPLYTGGMKKGSAFLLGLASAVLETLGGILTVLASAFLIGILPYLMCFAAGAMIYIVIGELCPEISGKDGSQEGVLLFVFGFSLMMVLDVALG